MGNFIFGILIGMFIGIVLGIALACVLIAESEDEEQFERWRKDNE